MVGEILETPHNGKRDTFIRWDVYTIGLLAGLLTLSFFLGAFWPFFIGSGVISATIIGTNLVRRWLDKPEDYATMIDECVYQEAKNFGNKLNKLNNNSFVHHLGERLHLIEFKAEGVAFLRRDKVITGKTYLDASEMKKDTDASKILSLIASGKINPEVKEDE